MGHRIVENTVARSALASRNQVWHLPSARDADRRLTCGVHAFTALLPGTLHEALATYIKNVQ